MRANAEVALPDAVPQMPCDSLLDPVGEPLLGLRRRDEVLHLHLLELERPEDEVARRDLVAERLADLRDPERRLSAGDLRDVLEVDEDPLRGLGAQVRVEPRLLDRADPRLEHEVELSGLGEVAVGRLARMLAGLAAALRLVDVVGPVPELAEPAVHERVVEALDVTRGLPDRRVEDDEESRATMSSRSRTIASSQRALTFSLRRTP